MAELHIRNLDDGVAEQIRRSAAARSLTLSAYITALSNLHRHLLAMVGDHPNHDTNHLLDVFGLGRVED